LTDSVDLSHAPVPTNDSERLLFRQLYHNLVRVDCQGQVHPELAAAWVFDPARRSWTFTLRDTTLSPDGSRLLSAQVLASWRGRPRVLGALGIDSVIAASDRTLIVGVSDTASEPKLFAQPALSIALNPGLSLPSSGQFRSSSGGPTVLDFLTLHGDVRDALDSGIDLLVTRDLDLTQYAARRRDLQTFALPWSETYVLVQPSNVDTLQGFAEADSVRQSLAEAVRAEARPASSELPRPRCRGAAATPSSGPPAARVVHRGSDAAARGLAERIVALNGADPQLRVEALSDSAFAASLRAGAARAYIVSLSLHPDDSCAGGLALPPGASIRPLIDTRARAIVRHGSPPLTVDWDGTLRLAAPARPPGPP
jgi:hypothetical protein